MRLRGFCEALAMEVATDPDGFRITGDGYIRHALTHECPIVYLVRKREGRRWFCDSRTDYLYPDDRKTLGLGHFAMLVIMMGADNAPPPLEFLRPRLLKACGLLAVPSEPAHVTRERVSA